jgi:hypothetical protein
MDFLFVGIALGCFALSAGSVYAFERLQRRGA